jgi:Lrp/AsnC family transcriptional regulator, leucine-responsive regulatory protein
MNRSRYVTRQLDETDREIIAALTENGRASMKSLGERVGMSSPSVSDRLLKIEDAGAIRGYTTNVDYKVFGYSIVAHLRISAKFGQAQRVEKLLHETPAVIEADHVTGENCFLARVVATDTEALQAVVDRFQPHAAVDTAILLSPTVAKRLPNLGWR